MLCKYIFNDQVNRFILIQNHVLFYAVYEIQTHKNLLTSIYGNTIVLKTFDS